MDGVQAVNDDLAAVHAVQQLQRRGHDGGKAQEIIGACKHNNTSLV